MQNSAPQRILQEASRVAQGLRTRQAAEIQDRNNTARDMEQNYRIESSQRQRDYQITAANFDAKAAAKGAQIQARATAQQEMWQGIANFSAGAAKAYTDFTAAQSANQIKTDINEFMVNPEYRANLLSAHDAMVMENSAALAEANGSTVAGEVAGLVRPVNTGRALIHSTSLVLVRSLLSLVIKPTSSVLIWLVRWQVTVCSSTL